MNSVLRKGISCFLSGIMIFAAFTGLIPFEKETAYADEDTTEITDSSNMSNQQLYDELAGNDNEPDGYHSFNQGGKDPYGYGNDEPFYMNKQSELAVYATARKVKGQNDTSEKEQFTTIDSYNLASGRNEGYVLNGAKKGTSYNIQFDKKLNYVKMVAFDPTKSGRKDHIAVIGVYNEEQGKEDKNKNLYLYVYNKDGTVVSDLTELGSMNWMGAQYDEDNDTCWLYNAYNFLDITAGDYDGDGKDTLVVWGCYDLKVDSQFNAEKSYGLKEITVTDEGNKISLSTSSDASLAMVHDVYKTNSGNKMASQKGWVDNRLCCSLDTGDVNGDKIDDLIALSFVDILTNKYDGRDQIPEMYRPYLSVSYGEKKKAVSPVDDRDAAIGVWNNTSGNSWLTCMAADVSAGDINGDGVEEVVTAGMKNVVKGTPGVTSGVSAYSNVDEDKTVIGVYSFNADKPKQDYFDEQNSNAWTRSGLYPRVSGDAGTTEDQCMQQYCVKTVAINGKGNPEMIFINGDLYSYADGDFTKKYASEYFQDSDAKFMDTGTNITNLFMISAEAGNFDGNGKGYEQVVFTLGFKTQGYEQYHAALGMVGGMSHSDQTGIASSYYATGESMYEDYDTNRKYMFPYVNGITSEGNHNLYKAHLGDNAGFNYCICAVDNDDDGILARYHAKGYAYTDPEVLGVLQAAPYFDELIEFGGGGSTTYSFSHTISEEDTETDSVSFGAGVTHGLEGTLGGYEVKAGYAMDWSKDFTKGWQKTKSYSYRADYEDAVILFRTPVVLYMYQVKTKDGEWETENDDNYIMISVPEQPAYEMLTVDRYNKFAEYYNNTNIKKMKEKYPDDPNAEKKAPKLGLLEDTDTEQYYLNTGGDPSKYISDKRIPSGVNVLQDTRMAFTASTGATGFSYSEEHSTTVSESMSHGFTFELTISFDLGIKCFVSSSVGAYVSLEYMHGHSHSTTKANGTETGCEVNNAVRSNMLNAGFSEEACDNYKYCYQMAEWSSPIMEEAAIEDPVTHKVTNETHYVPIIGYVISSIRKPVYPALSLPADLILNEGYLAAASGAFHLYGDPFPTVTKVSGNDKITYNAITRKLEVKPGLAKGTYPVKLKIQNGIPGKEAVYTYKVTVQTPDTSDTGLVNNVKNLIESIPDPVELLLSDEIYVKQARDAYDALSDALKAKIPGALKKKLEDAETQIAGFITAAADSQSLIEETVPGLASTMDAMIDNISSYSIGDINDLTDQFLVVRNTYDALSNEQKALVSTASVKTLNTASATLAQVWDKYDEANMSSGEYKTKQDEDKEVAKDVKELIAKIGDANAIDPSGDEETFEAQYQAVYQATAKARKAFNELTIQQQRFVDNSDVLFAAELKLGTLITERRETEAAQIAEKAYNDVVSLIKKIPATVKLTNEKAVLAAKAAYLVLSKDVKAKIPATLVTKLNKAVNKIKALKRTTSLVRVRGAKKALKVTWKKQATKVNNARITGYQIQIATNSKFTKGKKLIKVKGYAKTAKTIKKLKAKKKYWARIRTYAKVNGTTVYTKWSKSKYAKTK